MLPLDHVEAPVIQALALPKNATVVVIGAYQGSTVRFIRQNFFDARIFAYEPQKFAYEILINNGGVGLTVKTKCYNFALGMKSMPEAKLYEADTDAASLIPLPNSRASTTVEVVDAKDAFARDDITRIHFMLMNIEGYEYYLLPYILKLRGITIDTILVQFHFREIYTAKWRGVREDLEILGYNYLQVGAGWELWQI